MNKHVLKFRAEDKDKFDQIVNGAKTIETRAGTPRYQKINAGDALVIRCGNQEIQKTVTKIEHFVSVEAIYNSPNFAKVLPGITSLQEAEEIYYAFSSYKEKIAKHGLLAFYLD
jgi:ASC-1-like (ASCH) protein